MYPDEAERVAFHFAAPEHGRQHDRLAGAVPRARDVEPLRPASDHGAELVAFGEIFVDDAGPEE
jgi:hypothetical protein